MKNWFVIVDNQYLVSVAAETNGGAEHKVLDGVYGTKSALAYDPLTEGGVELYRTMSSRCTTVSFRELCHLGNMDRADKLDMMNRALCIFYNELKAAREAEEELQRMYEKLSKERWVGCDEDIRAQMMVVSDRNLELSRFSEKVTFYKRAFGVNDEIVSEEEIERIKSSYEPKGV